MSNESSSVILATPDVPAELLQLREEARPRLAASRDEQARRVEERLVATLADLKDAVTREVEPAILPYLDEASLPQTPDVYRAWPTFRVPGHCPVQALFVRGGGRWLRQHLGVTAAGGASAWRVLPDPDDCDLDVAYAADLGTALVLAQREAAPAPF